MLNRRPDREPTAYDDDWEDIPTSGPLPKWGGGVLLPIGLVAYGAVCLITGKGEIPGRYMSMDVSGTNAAALGLAILGLGLFLHFHYYWGNIYYFAAFAVLGKIASMAGVICGLGYLIIHIGVLGH